jgi:starch-binding outer membrane protein, SusD/RagB family
MKKINLFKFGIVVLIVSLFISCDAEVDTKDEIVDTNAITNMEQLEKALIGVYGSVGGSNLISWSAYFTDECRKPTSNRGQGVQVHTWSINGATGEPAAIYAGLYGTINRVNTVLSKIDNVPTNTAASINRKAQILAELKVIRASAHFDLFRFFTTDYNNQSALSIPIVDNVIFYEELPRNTVAQVISFVKSELESSYNSLNTLGTSNDNTKVRPIAIQALRARVALYTKDYANAITFANQVIAQVPFVTTAAAYRNIWLDTNNDEVIFKFKRVLGNETIGRIFRDTNGDVFFNVSNYTYSRYSTGDMRSGVGVLFETGSTLDNIKVGKYSGPASNYGQADIKYLRVSEMHLILAEALALKVTPDLTASATALNTLRAARRTAPTALPNQSFIDQNDAVDKILDERIRELSYEGHRFFDLKRHNKPVSRLASDVLLNTFAQNLIAGDYRFTLPIPQGAIDVNKNLVQNPNY